MDSASTRPRPISESPQGKSVSERLDLALTTWRKRLLDLTKRNRALNFKPAKVSTVTIVDEQPAEVFRRLCGDSKPMRFSPTLPSAAKKKAADAAGPTEPVDEDEEPQPAELDFAPYDPDQLDDRHTDDVLQALATPEALDKSLRRLEEQARSAIEEQGVNILFLALGMLHYTESADSTDVLRAPLILLPVCLNRKSARSGYVLEMTDDDPMVNPALSEYLQRSFGIELPSLPATDDGIDLSSVRAFYQKVSDIAADRVKAGFSGWAVKTDIFLGLFAFQKLVMFKDLETNADAFGAHSMVRQLVMREAVPGAPITGLPRDVCDLELDRQFAPEQTAQIVDADSSQLRAIVAVSKGYSLVLEGPPGTGKSQTITNLIAQALSENKSVLFVAEKMAALQVVYRRLVSSGLGEFCLELHASKANKRVVMQEIKAAIDASLQRPRVERSTQRLPMIRAQLSDYVDAVHTPAVPLGISPYAATGMLDAVLHAPRYAANGSLDSTTLEGLTDTERLLDDLAAAAQSIGAPSAHPWRDSSRTFYTPRAIDELRASLDSLIGQLDVLARDASEIERSFSLPAIRTIADVGTAAKIARVFESSPGAPLGVLQSEAWNSPPAEATSLIAAGRQMRQWRTAIHGKFTQEVFDQEHSSDASYIEQKSSGLFGFLAFLDGRYRAIKSRWLRYRKPNYTGSLAAQAADMKLVDRYNTARADIDAKLGVGRALFGGLWQGEQSKWELLESYVAWVVEVRGVCVKHGLSAAALTIASAPKPDVSRVIALQAAAHEASTAIDALRRSVEWPPGYLDNEAIPDIAERLRGMRAAIGAAVQWAVFEDLRQKAMASPAAALVEIAMRNTGAESDIPFAALGNMFRRAVLERFLERVISERVPLREFRTLTHEQRLKEFRQLDERVLKENRAAVVDGLRQATQQRLQQPDARAGLPFVQREMAKQRKIAPLRKTLQNAEATVRAIKPCFLMSPLTVAQYLNGKAASFDLVIFDEASQLPTEDAVGAIARGRQLVVVGDPKQLPPTNFFASTETTSAPLGDDGLPIVEDAESVLEEYMGAGVPVTRLKWHYRSAHESLINFSNVSFYDSDLYTFPSVETNSDTSGLSFELVSDGVYEGKGLNMAEARRVADAVMRHAKERPHESLGVGTFNMRQQLAILDELELRRREDPSTEPFFARSDHEPFFVKNLENIQGDERDVIFLSVTYAKGPDGRLRYNFGPISGENGWRRLNVLTTRARKRMRVFSSMRGDDINPAGTTARGALLLRDFLKYAETGRLDSVVANASAAAESPFEQEVATELVRRGIKVVPQVGVAGYRIDIGVLDDDVPGRFVCGIECDGVAYHSAETARDRDRLRQQVLEARGWTIVRVWSTDWFKDRAGQIDRLTQAVERSKGDAKERIAAEAEADARAKELAEAERREASQQVQKVEVEKLSQTRGALETGSYVRPTAAPYQFAPGHGRHANADFLETPTSQVFTAVLDVVNVESPVHSNDVASRVAGMWGLSRVGSRIAAKIEEAVRMAVRGGNVVQRGEFLWTDKQLRGGAALPVRSRSGTRIPGERVAPEEVRQAIVLVLRAAGGMTGDEVLSEVRHILGVSKAGLASTVESELQALLGEGVIGEGSAGFALRQEQHTVI